MSNLSPMDKLLEDFKGLRRDSLTSVIVCKHEGEFAKIPEDYFLPNYVKNRILISSLPPAKNWPEVFIKKDSTGCCLIVSMEPFPPEDPKEYFSDTPKPSENESNSANN